MGKLFIDYEDPYSYGYQYNYEKYKDKIPNVMLDEFKIEPFKKLDDFIGPDDKDWSEFWFKIADHGLIICFYVNQDSQFFETIFENFVDYDDKDVEELKRLINFLVYIERTKNIDVLNETDKEIEIYIREYDTEVEEEHRRRRNRNIIYRTLDEVDVENSSNSNTLSFERHLNEIRRLIYNYNLERGLLQDNSGLNQINDINDVTMADLSINGNRIEEDMKDIYPIIDFEVFRFYGVNAD